MAIPSLNWRFGRPCPGLPACSVLAMPQCIRQAQPTSGCCSLLLGAVCG